MYIRTCVCVYFCTCVRVCFLANLVGHSGPEWPMVWPISSARRDWPNHRPFRPGMADEIGHGRRDWPNDRPFRTEMADGIGPQKESAPSAIPARNGRRECDTLANFNGRASAAVAIVATAALALPLKFARISHSRRPFRAGMADGALSVWGPMPSAISVRNGRSFGQSRRPFRAGMADEIGMGRQSVGVLPA